MTKKSWSDVAPISSSHTELLCVDDDVVLDLREIVMLVYIWSDVWMVMFECALGTFVDMKSCQAIFFL